ncbi:glucosyltransferase [Coemansia javaensis]|uniref:Dol-P-Glc:Glc(2)Man(9)GlcNAc(2)-PP-Dol alpha-1,2-glucosyltransferase n=1 Tax=Coemansia javaensis TaxID=2761396 RepID=A0A9W8HJT4_9FUNG|nr:glucosyltransferase [Coemansia javaensis]
MEAAAAFAVYAATSYAVLRRVGAAAGEPYMDEVFHIPQAQRYCAGDFGAWDPKLTTPPGLYLASAAALAAARAPCTVAGLRATNWALGLALFWTLHGLVRRLHGAGRGSAGRAAAATLALALFPVTFFFHHLYYTDTAAVLAVLAAYLLSLHGRHALAGAAGAASLWMRQTNVVWVAFIGASAALRWLGERRGVARAGEPLGRSVAQLGAWAAGQRRGAGDARALARLLAPYAGVAALFGGFVAANGGIVLGDKAHHRAQLHAPQLLYFGAYVAAMAAPAVLAAGAGPGGLARAVARRPARSLALAAAMAGAVRCCTVEHPFLLSDNRHYPFYVWKNVFRRHWAARYAAVPAYVCAATGVQRALRRTPALWQLGLALCAAAALVPSPLLELRYFTVPYYFARLHMPLAGSRAALAAELAWFAAINAATIWLFLSRPFAWDSEPGRQQRFMW